MDKELEASLQLLLDTVNKYPELAEVLRQSKLGQISEQEAMVRMNQFALEHPDFVSDLMQPESRPEPELTLSPVGEVLPPDGSLSLFKPSSNGLPRLNPLVEAALIERIQYDGDIPELRSGPLPEGTKPAVSVKTKSRNPVAIGHMLENASQRIGKQIREAEEERKNSLIAAHHQVLEDIGNHAELVKKSDQDLSIALYGSPETDIPEYRRGKVSAPVRSRRPSGSALAAMTPQEKREKAFQFFSTTQGRRSAIPVIQELVATSLRGEGLEVTERVYNPRAAVETPLAFHEWAMSLSGAGATQATFSVIDVAANVLAKMLGKQMQGHPGVQQVILEVTPVNQVDTRTIGWAARLLAVVEREEGLINGSEV